MESCERYIELLSQSLDEPLSSEDQAALARHLSQCPQCRALSEQLNEIHTQLGQWPEQEVPEGFAQGVMDRISALDEAPKIIPLWRRPQVRAIGSLAACAVLCVGLFRLMPAEHDAAAPAPVQARTAQVSEQPAAFAMEETPEFFDEDALIASISDGLGTQPGCVALFEQIPEELSALGAWKYDSQGRSILVMEDRPEQFSDAVYCVELGEGPAVCMVWPFQ